MKPLPESDFRARRYLLEKSDFAMAEGEYAGPTDLIDKHTWKSMVTLPDDVSIRTSDRYGSQLAQMWEFWGTWPRVVGSIQALSAGRAQPESPTAIAACNATDDFQAATYAALVGHYRVAYSCLRNVIEQVSIAAQLAISKNADNFGSWMAGDDRIKLSWAADLLPKGCGPSYSQSEGKRTFNSRVLRASLSGTISRPRTWFTLRWSISAGRVFWRSRPTVASSQMGAGLRLKGVDFPGGDSMNAALLVAIFVSVFCSIILCFLGKQSKAAQDKARARRMAEHRMNARLLRLNI